MPRSLGGQPYPGVPLTTFSTPLGRCQVTWQGQQLVNFRLPAGDDILEPPPSKPTPPWVADIIERVQRHLRGDFQDFRDLPYDFATVAEFPREVYQATLAIPVGSTRSYGEIARALGRPVGVSRAVGTALGANPWPLLIPCHRVVAANGKMTGFSAPGGIRTKLRLLAIEGEQLFSE